MLNASNSNETRVVDKSRESHALGHMKKKGRKKMSAQTPCVDGFSFYFKCVSKKEEEKNISKGLACSEFVKLSSTHNTTDLETWKRKRSNLFKFETFIQITSMKFIIRYVVSLFAVSWWNAKIKTHASASDTFSHWWKIRSFPWENVMQLFYSETLRCHKSSWCTFFALTLIHMPQWHWIYLFYSPTNCNHQHKKIYFV